MPHMLNGFGTWNFGKRNLHSYVGTCEQCGVVTTLSSYDTQLYITALFLPLIPLKRGRVIAHCPACNKYRHIPLREWESNKTKAFDEVRHYIAHTPSDTEAAKQALAKTFAFQDPAMFSELVPAVLTHHRGNPEVLKTMAAGYEFFGRPRDAEEVLRAVLSLQDFEDVREDLARLLLLDGRPDEARPLLAHVTRGPKREALGLLALLVEAYQAQGRHQEALEVIFEVQHIFPDTESDKEWTRFRKLAEKNVTTSKAVPSRNLNLRAKPTKEEPARWASFVGPIVFLVAFALFLSTAVSKGGGHEAYLVSGTEQPYTVTLDGTEYTLRPDYPLSIKLPEGVHTIAAESLPTPEQTFEIKTNFLTRPFSDRFFVVNPDHVALLQWEETEYMEKPDETGQYKSEIRTNELVHEFRGINFKFEEFPEQVKTSGSRTTRRRVGFFTLFSENDPELTLTALHSFLDPDSFTRYIAAKAHLNPNDPLYLFALGNVLEPEAFQQEMNAELKQRPVLVEAHRVYQTLLETKRPGHDIEKEYAELSAGDPGNADLGYLHARVMEDDARSEELLQKAISAPTPSAHAYGALAFSRLSRGQFEEALPFAQQAVGLMPGNPSFVQNFREIQWARRDYDAILNELERGKDGVPVSVAEQVLELRLLAMKGLPDEQIQPHVVKALQALRKTGIKDDEIIKSIKQGWEASIAYSREDFDTYAKLSNDDDDPSAVFHIALRTGDIERAVNAIQPAEMEGVTALTLYAAAAHAGKAELAQAFLDKGIEFLRGEGREERQMAACLAGEQPADADALCQLMVFPDTKRVVLTVLGLRFPQDQAKYFDMARRLNYKVEFPYDVLKRILGDGSAQTAAPVTGAEQAPVGPTPEAAVPGVPEPPASTPS